MRRKSLYALALCLWATTLPGPAQAVVARLAAGPDAPAGRPATRLAGPARARMLEQSPAWQAFRARYGDWTAIWNAATGTPHRAFGRGIALSGFAPSADAVDASLRAFVAGHPATFGRVDGLDRTAVFEAGGRWYARYRQTFHGLPVLFSDWEFRVGDDGRLFAFGADARSIPPDTRIRPLIPGSLAREAAIAGLPFDRARDRAATAAGLALLPRTRGERTDFRLVYEVHVRTARPPGRWVVFVDAANGTVLWRLNRVRHAIDGTVTGAVHLVLPTDPPATVPFAQLTVLAGTGTGVTDAAGTYLIPAAGAVTVSAGLAGPFANVHRADGTDALFLTGASDPATVDIDWNAGNSQDSERDAFYHVNVAHDFAKNVDPAFTGVDYAMPVAVNIADVCNAYWDGTGVNFFAAGGGCINTATLPDVVYHEYGHGVNDRLYIQAGQPLGMTNGALHEGLADVNAALIRDDPLIGQGFFGPGTSIRTIDNTLRYPQDLSGDPHATGLIVAGAVWDLRQALGLPLAEHLAHFAKYGTPDDADDGVAMGEYFVEMLVADDDDADLSNGTPHSGMIVTAFNAHGIGTGRFIDIIHDALADQPAATPYPITATIDYSGPLGALDPAAVILHYAVNGGGPQTLPMTPTGNPSEFSASIPGQTAALVRYWIEAHDTEGGVQLDPPTAPAASFAFIAGPTTTLLDEPMETQPGYVVGGPLDDATTGIWAWGDPVGTSVGAGYVQPEDDHSDPGVSCWFTGNAAAGAGAGTNDVDNGRTTLTTTAFDAGAGGNLSPVIEYWKWYSNDQGGAPASDVWRVELSGDGGTTWAVVESTTVSTQGWEQVVFFIDDVLTPTADMKLRFVASDEGTGSLVEAAIDDLRVIDFTTVLAADPLPHGAFQLSSLAPNPFVSTTRLGFTLPAAAQARVQVFDVHGRAVRTLAAGAFEPGRHTVEWNGLDGAGHPVPGGVYFVRLDSPFGDAVRRVVRMR